MRAGIVGLPSTGKTTLFRALTRGTVPIDEYGQSGKPNIGVVSVPDRRVDFFVAEYHPKKVTYASIEFIDGAVRAQDGAKGHFGAEFFADVRQVDALVHVVRGFESPGGDAPTPVQDLQALNDELVLADLQLVENRTERVEKQLHGVKKGAITAATIEMTLLQKLRAHLEQGASLQSADLTPDEQKAIRGYDFLTLKPMIAVLNEAEADIGRDTPVRQSFDDHCKSVGIQGIALCAKVEMEVAELGDEEEAEFLASMGIEEPARNILIHECYRALGLISFFTTGEPEVRAWTLTAGERAIDAAGAIHSDLARGFIRMEVANFPQVEAVGGWEAARREGVAHLQGKDYVMKDGDVVYVRFKV